jgi:hypothetical protein
LVFVVFLVLPGGVGGGGRPPPAGGGGPRRLCPAGLYEWFRGRCSLSDQLSCELPRRFSHRASVDGVNDAASGSSPAGGRVRLGAHDSRMLRCKN